MVAVLAERAERGVVREDVAALEVLDPGDVGVAMVAYVRVSAPKTEEAEGETEAAAEGKEPTGEASKE